MKVVAKHTPIAYVFEDIESGEVFHSALDPDRFLLRTDHDSWVAVDLESGVLYHKADFNLDEAIYTVVDAQVAIEAIID